MPNTPTLLGILLIACTTAAAQPEGDRPGHAHGRGEGRHGAHGQEQAADQALFHRLLDARSRIRRSVTNIPNGVRTVTESDDPEITATIQQHVHSMHRRLVERRPIHRRDPLFDTIFAHADAIEMKIDDTPTGVRVVETSADPWVASLIQEHARVLSRFLEYGHEEVRRNHAVPPRPAAP